MIIRFYYKRETKIQQKGSTTKKSKIYLDNSIHSHKFAPDKTKTTMNKQLTNTYWWWRPLQLQQS
ncbi:hypothetical protein B5F34_10145 [Mediterranea sp. An20]|nr:hypothetical protein B5F34_10145 [Mediterranea sp. An20]